MIGVKPPSTKSLDPPLFQFFLVTKQNHFMPKQSEAEISRADLRDQEVGKVGFGLQVFIALASKIIIFLIIIIWFRYICAISCMHACGEEELS